MKKASIKSLPLLMAVSATLLFGGSTHALVEGDNNGGPTGTGSQSTTATDSSNGISTNSVADGCAGQGVKVSIWLTGSNQCTDPNMNPIFAYMKAMLGWLAGLIGVVIVIGYMLGGYLWMTSAGNADRIKKAKTRIGQATVSLLLFLFMAAILRYLIPGIF